MFTVKSLHKNIRCRVPWTISLPNYILVDLVFAEKAALKSDVWLTVRRNSVWIRKTNLMSLFVFFISLLIVSQHVSGNHVSIIRS